MPRTSASNEATKREMIARRALPEASVTSGRWGGLGGLLVSNITKRSGATAVVLLHGFGGSPAGPRLSQAAKLIAIGCRANVVIPAALEAHAEGRAWWGGDGKFWPAHASGDEQGLKIQTPGPVMRARLAVLRVLRVVRKEFTPRRLVLAGYSQGAMLAIDVALAKDRPVDAVALLAGRLLEASIPRLGVTSGGRPPVFMAHGRADEVVPFAEGERLRERLEQYGHAVTWRPFAGDHRIPPPRIMAGLLTFIG